MKEYGTLGGKILDRPEDHDKFYEEFLIPDVDETEQVSTAEEEAVPQHDAMAYARDTVDHAVAESDYFIGRAHERGVDLSDTSSTEYLRLLYDITNEYLDQEQNKQFFMEIDGGETYHAIRLFGVAPYAMRQEVTLDSAEANGSKYSSTAKPAVIALNHALFDLVSANPKRKLTDIAEQVDLVASAYDHEAKGYAYNVMLQNGKGIRTEYAFWQAVNYRRNPDHSIRHGSAQEDGEGIDFVVGLQDAIELSVDLKSSLAKVKEKAAYHEPTEQEPYTKTEDGKYVYCLRTTEDSFMKGSFELDLSEKIKLRNKVLEDLQKMAKL